MDRLNIYIILCKIGKKIDLKILRYNINNITKIYAISTAT
jgi:hypothetical protein